MPEERFEVPVAVDDAPPTLWALSVTNPSWREIALTLADPHGRHWEARRGDVFDALMDLRLQLEPLGIQVCCNGA